MFAMDLAPEARYKDVRSVKYERPASKVNRVLYISIIIYKGKLVEGSSRCSGTVRQVQ